MRQLRNIAVLAAAGAVLAVGTPALAAKCPLVVLILDHSGSMDATPQNGIPSASMPSKWTIATTALPMVLNQYSYLPWGFISFGDAGATCTDFSTEPVMNPKPGQVPQIIQTIGTLMPDGPGTNTGEAIDKAVGMIQTALAADPDRPGAYILLLTDGQPNCNSNEPSFTISRIADAYQSHMIKTFVIGFGALTGSDDTNMIQMANAGGAPCTGTACKKAYYAADSAQTLNDALNAISNVIAGEFGGMCDDSCYGSTGCPNAGDICVQGTCKPNPCANVSTCAPGDYCLSNGTSAGTCVKSCPQCQTGQTCDTSTGTCVQDLCPSCVAQGKGCLNNTCVPQQCDAAGTMKCNAGVACINGVCTDDPCRWTTCPDGTACQQGGYCIATSASGGKGTRGRGGCDVAQPGFGSGAPAALAGFALMALAALLASRRRRA